MGLGVLPAHKLKHSARGFNDARRPLASQEERTVASTVPGEYADLALTEQTNLLGEGCEA